MQEEFLKPTDVVGAKEVQIAVDTLVDVAVAAPNSRDRVNAAETLLRYGVRDPYWTAPPEPEIEDEG